MVEQLLNLAADTQTVDESGFNGLIFVLNFFEELKARVHTRQ